MNNSNSYIEEKKDSLKNTNWLSKLKGYANKIESAAKSLDKISDQIDESTINFPCIKIQRTGDKQWNVQKFIESDDGTIASISNYVLRSDSLEEVNSLKIIIENLENPKFFQIIKNFSLDEKETRSLFNRVKTFRRNLVTFLENSKIPNIASRIVNRLTIPMFEVYGKKIFFELKYSGEIKDLSTIEIPLPSFPLEEYNSTNLNVAEALQKLPFSDPFTQIAAESFQSWQKNFKFKKDLDSEYKIVLKQEEGKNFITLDLLHTKDTSDTLINENKEAVKAYRKFLENEYGAENIKKVEHRYSFALETLEKNGMPLLPEHIYRMNIGLNMIENNHLEGLIAKLKNLKKLEPPLDRDDLDLFAFFSDNLMPEFSIRELRGIAREFRTTQRLNSFINEFESIKNLEDYNSNQVCSLTNILTVPGEQHDNIPNSSINEFKSIKNLEDYNSNQVCSLMNILTVPDEQHDNIYTGRKILDHIILGYYNGETTRETSFIPWLDDQELLQTSHLYKANLPTPLEIAVRQCKEYIEAFNPEKNRFCDSICEKFNTATIDSTKELEERLDNLKEILDQNGISYKLINADSFILNGRDFSLDAAHIFMKKHLASKDTDGIWKVGGIIPGPKSSKKENQFYCVTSCTDNGLGNMNFTFEPLGKDSELPVRQVFRSTASGSYNQNGAQSVISDIDGWNSPGERGFTKAAKYDNPFYDKYTQPLWAAYHEHAKELLNKSTNQDNLDEAVQYYQVASQNFEKSFLKKSKCSQKKYDYDKVIKNFSAAKNKFEKKEIIDKEYLYICLSTFDELGKKYKELSKYKKAKHIVIDGHSLGGGLSQQAYYNQLITRGRLPLAGCRIITNCFDPTKGADKHKNTRYSNFTKIHQKFLEKRLICCHLNLEFEKGDFVPAAGSEHIGLDESPESFIEHGQKIPKAGFSIRARFFQPLDHTSHQNMILTDKAHMRKFNSTLVEGRDICIKNLSVDELRILAGRDQFSLNIAKAIKYSKELTRFNRKYGFSPLFNPQMIDLARRALGVISYIPARLAVDTKKIIRPTRGSDQNDAEGIFHVNIDKTKNSELLSKPKGSLLKIIGKTLTVLPSKKAIKL